MNRFVTSRTEEEVFSDLESLCASPGYIHVLAYLSMRDNFIFFGDSLTADDTAASYDPERTIRTEFSTLVGLMLKNPIVFDLPFPEVLQELIDKTRSLLDELHACLNRPMVQGIQESIALHKARLRRAEDADSFLGSGEVLREPIFYGGESAYNFQYRDFSLERYAKDDDWLRANRGFRIAEAHAVATALVRIQSRKVMKTIEGLKSSPPSQWTILPGFTSSIDEIALDAGVISETASAVLAAFTSPEPPTNAGFTALGEFNLANACPILRTPSGDYISLETYGFVEALYESPFYWMAADKSYKDKAFAHRGAFTESFVATRLSAVFGKDRAHRNVNILKKGDHIGEIDVLVLFADRAIVVQCKSKKLTMEARKGNDLRLQNDFKKSVQDAYDQAYLCSNALTEPEYEFIGDDGIRINLPEFREIYPVCIVSDHYPALAVQARQFLKYEARDAIQPPLVADVFLVDVLVEMLSSPLRLLSYVNRRVNYGERINSFNELTILGYHLRQNLWIDEKTHMLWLADDVAMHLDTAMMVRREGMEGERTPKGILTRLDGTLVGRIIESIEHRGEPGLVDLGFMLLTLDDGSLKDIDRGLKEISARTREDGRHHNFTLAFGESDTGLTVHCGPLSDAEAGDMLAEYCHRRKYARRAKSWFGLVVHAADGLPKFGLNLRFPWKQDDAMDELTKDMARGERPSRSRDLFKRRKVGRNELCPCGSGKKYKKCCLN